MELQICLWVGNITVFIRELIRFFKKLLPDKKIEYTEKLDVLDNFIDREIYLNNTGISINIYDYKYIGYLSEEYGTDVNVEMGIDVVGSMYDESSVYIAEMINWILRTSETDLAIENECSWLIFKRMKGKYFYAKICESFPFNYFPGDTLEFDREKAFAYTKEDEWVFRSKKHIQEIEEWGKKQEMESEQKREDSTE